MVVVHSQSPMSLILNLPGGSVDLKDTGLWKSLGAGTG